MLMSSLHKLVLDVAGFSSIQAVSGRNGAKGADFGANGGDGRDAGPAQPGRNAGSVEIALTLNKDTVHVYGKRVDCTSSRHMISRELPLDGDIEIHAKGGAGGQGGFGGDGGMGRAGRAGSPATQFREGGDGSRGGNGGHGGDGTPGADGGNGGSVQVTVRECDADLLAMLNVDVSGGAAGAPGRNGAGGQGGPGGAGGNSYTWTAHHMRPLFTGKGVVTQTTSTRHKKEGGHAGLRGASGLAGRAHVHSGNAGAAGSTMYRIETDHGIYEYTTQYKPGLTPPRLLPINSASIEPGSLVQLTTVASNWSIMPLPNHLSVAIQNEAAARVPLRSGLSHRETQEISLQFEVPYRTPPRGQRSVQNETVTVGVQADRLGRVLPHSSAQTNYQASFPIEITSLNAVETSLVPGQLTPLQWRITNLSDEHFGAELGQRAIALRTQFEGGNVLSSQLMFQATHAETPMPLGQAIEQKLASLPPRASIDLRGYLSCTADAKPYAHGQLLCELLLASPSNPQTMRTAQAHELTFQIAQRYVRDPAAGLLVVTNKSTTPEEVASWESLADELRTHVVFWNMSTDGTAHLTRAIEKFSLANEMHNKTIVVLNNLFTQNNALTRTGVQWQPNELLEAAVKAGIGTYVVGADHTLNVRDQFKPTPSSVQMHDHASIQAYEKAHYHNADALLSGHRIAVNHRFSVLTKEQLNKEANRLISQHRARWPEQSVHASVQLRSKYNGIIELYVGHDLNGATSVEMAMQDLDELHAQSFITSPENRFALCKALPFALKLSLWQNMPEQSHMREPLLRAILSDLAAEQQLLRQSDWRGSLNREELCARMPRLSQLCACFKTLPEVGSALHADVIECLAELNIMLADGLTPADKILWWRRRYDANTVATTKLAPLVRSPQIQSAIHQRMQELRLQRPLPTMEQRLSMHAQLYPQGFVSERMKTSSDLS